MAAASHACPPTRGHRIRCCGLCLLTHASSSTEEYVPECGYRGHGSDGSAPGGVPRRESVAMHRCSVQRSLIHPPATRFTRGTAFSLLDHSHSLEHICPDELQCSRLITKQRLARARWSVCPWPSAVPASYGGDSRRPLHSSLHDVIHQQPHGPRWCLPRSLPEARTPSKNMHRGPH